MNQKEDMLLTSDPLIEGVHFLPDTPPSLVGRKAVSRALSDIAGMGGKPKWALINISAPKSMELKKLKSIYRGIKHTAYKYNMFIVGGDIGKSPQLAIHVFAIGTVPKNKAILRSNAKPGDAIFVTGKLGGSIFKKHLTFSPRLDEGIWLRKNNYANAMMDLSDGLGNDIKRLTSQSNCGAIIDTTKIPVSHATYKYNDDLPNSQHALFDGEDFELLFTVSKSKKNNLLKKWISKFNIKCTEIGEITKVNKIIYIGDNILENNKFFKHFK